MPKISKTQIITVVATLAIITLINRVEALEPVKNIIEG